MKKITALLFSAMLFMSIASFAQTNAYVDMVSAPASGSHVTDTVINAAMAYLTSPRISAAPKSTTVVMNAVKLTGTVAGTASLQGSTDGVIFTSASATTFTVTDLAAQNTNWILTGSPFLYYRVNVVGSGTSTYTIKANVFTRN